MLTSIVFASAALVASVSAINPIDSSIQTTWCGAQLTSCPLLCGGSLIQGGNTCVAGSGATLPTYNCTCSNGTAPGLAYYDQTIPSFICAEQYKECIAGNTTNVENQSACKTDNVCGQLDPASVTKGAGAASTSSSSTAASTTTATGSATTTSSTASATTTAAKSMALSVGQNMGMGIFAISAMAVFGLLL